ncbi:MAG: LysR family transcriptional regulator [Hyphomicrobiales bacterium]|nr:LysR family transcriptional regulator [Hyphomicrobiales bacterium]
MSVTHIDDLKIFARVVTAGNMSAAGRDMGLSPAVVSKRISGMEDRLGARLFQRTTRHLQLTEAGAGFYDRVIQILASIQEAEAFLAQGNGQARRLLRITAPSAFSRMHLAPHFSGFLQQYPDITLDLFASDAMVDIVSEGVDIAIRIAEVEDRALMAHKLAPCTRVLCATPGYLEKYGEPRNTDDLSGHNCIAIGSNSTWRLEGPDGPVMVRATANIRTNSSEVVRECVVAGLGIGLRSTWDIYKELKTGKLKVVLPKYKVSSRLGIYAVHQRQEHVPAKLRVFVEFLSDLYGSAPYWDADIDSYLSDNATNLRVVNGALR